MVAGMPVCARASVPVAKFVIAVWPGAKKIRGAPSGNSERKAGKVWQVVIKYNAGNEVNCQRGKMFVK
jgi:hypothetical protein